ncbi:MULTISPECIES: hypothetical protein [Acidiphilium]|uniref:ABC-type nickel/cobalt efflux system, permease component RcnA n=1 Tax=Acidiphilium rubrum TaxID=526 RepID=A0A8G2FFZ2_ACIRU|nr:MULTISPECIES: hypothetical protein [Acidiphilium]SIQ50538.1 hypothetical protein SAMN05421828_105148 [Acidiphilium rubrum]
MNTEALFLIVGVVGVGVLHTIVPDHWVPITLIARQRGWSRGETARVAFRAGVGHVLSTLAIGVAVWIAGAAFAVKFGGFVDAAASLALIAFGGWIAFSSLREMRGGADHGHHHGHSHSHGHSHALTTDAIHGPEQQIIDTGHGTILLSIFETGAPPRFRLTGPDADAVHIETHRDDAAQQTFAMVNRGAYWESLDDIPEPHGFAVTITMAHGSHAHRYDTAFAEHDHGDHAHHHHAPPSDALYQPAGGDVAVMLRHVHVHRHGSGPAHSHLHDHDGTTMHDVVIDGGDAPLHEHAHKTSSRTALMLILGSSPMVEGIPAFFAAGKFGFGVIAIMAIVFAISTIATYVALCIASTAGLQRISLGPLERYGEVLSGAFIVLVGVVFWVWPVI